MAVIFTSDDEKAYPIYLRLGERHIHKDRLSVAELDTFWDSFEWAVRRTLGAAFSALEARKLMLMDCSESCNPSSTAMMRLINHALRQFNKICRDSLFNGPTFMKAIVGRGAVCTVSREELDRPYVDLDRADAAYSHSPQFASDREAVKEAIGKLAADAANFGIMLMRKYVLS